MPSSTLSPLETALATDCSLPQPEDQLMLLMLWESERPKSEVPSLDQMSDQLQTHLTYQMFKLLWTLPMILTKAHPNGLSQSTQVLPHWSIVQLLQLLISHKETLNKLPHRFTQPSLSSKLWPNKTDQHSMLSNKFNSLPFNKVSAQLLNNSSHTEFKTEIHPDSSVKIFQTKEWVHSPLTSSSIFKALSNLTKLLFHNLLPIFSQEETAEVDSSNHSLTQWLLQFQSKPSMPTSLTLLLPPELTQLLLSSMPPELSLMHNSELTKLMDTFLLN